MTSASPRSFIEGDYEPKFQGFHDLMPHRVQEILLVSTFYDTFILEEDGELSERIFSEYLNRNLRYPPRITRVSKAARALKRLEQSRRFNLVVTMMRLPDMDGFEFAGEVKKRFPDMPVIMLAHDKHDLEERLAVAPRANVDCTLLWSGDTRILLAGIKLVEDRMNVDHDIRVGNLRVLIVVEDSVRYVSMVIPLIFTELMRLTQSLLEEGLNEMHRLLRMRARPKVLLAQSYEHALSLYKRYERNVIGIISDIRYPRGGELDPAAGFQLVETIRAKTPDMPFILMSAEPDNKVRADAMNVAFIDKNSRTLKRDFRHFTKNNLGFGDFTFRTPEGVELRRASNLRQLEECMRTVPIESIRFHGDRNHFSNWLMARTEFTLAEKIRPMRSRDFGTPDALRNYLVTAIREARREKQLGIIADFSKGLFAQEDVFLRMGSGSIGGKGRGLAFINALLARSHIREQFPEVKIGSPRTAVICTDYFEQFIDRNGLGSIEEADLEDHQIAARFLAGSLPPLLTRELGDFLAEVDYPIAVRSSSLLEDSQDQPLAGLYDTYMLPNSHSDPSVRLRQLSTAIKLVYASTYFKAPKAFLASTPSRGREEKMAVVIQQVVGARFGMRFYPTFSGVARSYNFYPVRYMEPEDGIAYAALGLGHMVVEGRKSLRFCPRHPSITMQLSILDTVLDTTQRSFYALDLSNPDIHLEQGERGTLVECDLYDAEKDGTLKPLVSVLSVEDGVLRDGIHHAGPRVISFAHILKWNTFPLAEIIDEFLKVGRGGLGTPVEIEFAADLKTGKKGKPEFYFLQIRPMVVGREEIEVDLGSFTDDELICKTGRALGNGRIEGLRDILYVRPDQFDPAKTVAIAAQIGTLNAKLLEEGRRYVLIGPGRWGTSDRWLGIPTTWDQMSNAKIIVESTLEGFMVEPSQGSHFFHNVTAFQLGYLSVSHRAEGEHIDWDWLASQPAFQETEYVRHVRLDAPLEARLNGRTRAAALIKPSAR